MVPLLLTLLNDAGGVVDCREIEEGVMLLTVAVLASGKNDEKWMGVLVTKHMKIYQC